jgi:ATP-binding cassette subfamily B protein RaxB
MISSHFGGHVGLSELRQRFPVSAKGISLDQLMRSANAINLSTRALRVEPNEFGSIAVPCILHWGFKHFVVLEKVLVDGRIRLLDPARGRVVVGKNEISEHFTGVVLELKPTELFTTKPPEKELGLFELMGRVHGLAITLARIFAVAVLVQILALASPLFNQFLIDEAIARYDLPMADVMLVGFVILMLVQSALGLLKGWMVIFLSQELSLQWRGKVFSHLLRLPIEFFENRHIGDVLSKFGALGALQQSITTTAIGAALNLILTLVAAAMMVVYSWPLAFIGFSFALAYGIFRLIAYGPFKQATSERIILSAKESTNFIESIRGIQAIKIFSKEVHRHLLWQNLVVDVQNRDVKTAKMGQWFGLVRQVIFGAESLTLLWLGARTIILGSGLAGSAPLTLGMFFAFAAYQRQFSDSVAGLIDAAIEMKMLSLHKERLADIVRSPAEELMEDRCNLNTEYGDESLIVEFRDVGFKYGQTDPWVLRGVNFRIGSCDFIGITGRSGAGKSTLIKLLLGLIIPTEGEILINGVPMLSYGLARYRQRIGAVMQSDSLFAGSIAENIAFGNEELEMDRVAECARLADIEREILAMPMGFWTLVGDMGSGLSGGQQQRIFIARALYKNPQLLILDEATSNLDVSTEYSFLKNIDQLKLAKVVISHRQETLGKASIVLEVGQGKVLVLDRVGGDVHVNRYDLMQGSLVRL